jgi:ribosomal protein S27AE
VEKVNIAELLKRLRKGEKPCCPQCKEGVVSTTHEPQSSHFFSCNRCNFMINID